MEEDNMKKTNILMIDDNKQLVEAVKEYFSNSDEIEVKYVASDGLDGLKLIEEKDDYDVVVLDLVMPNKDGMWVLEQLKEKGIDKKIIVETSYNAMDVIRQVSEYGVKYYLLKPFDLEDLEKRILQLNDVKVGKSIDLASNNIKSSITKTLHDLGIPSHIKGYQYIRDGVEIIFDRPEIIGGITKELYPELANKFETTVSRVERAIRHAIEVSWNRGDWDLMEELFGHSVDIDKAKPTNSEFMVTIADKLRLEYHKV
ncbi:MAG: sporulation transcription factor Spo0A [Bacilli bacterium]|nr:sporulation transcription factor Spo0A [Bacilli bacterium]